MFHVLFLQNALNLQLIYNFPNRSAGSFFIYAIIFRKQTRNNLLFIQTLGNTLPDFRSCFIQTN